MAKRFLVMRVMQTQRGGELRIPMASADSEEEAKRFAEEQNAHMAEMAELVVVAAGPDGRAQVVCKVKDLFGQDFGVTGIGHLIVPIGEIGAPEILLPKPGIIIQ